MGWPPDLPAPLIRTQGQGPSHIACPPLTHTLGGRDVGPLTPPKAKPVMPAECFSWQRDIQPQTHSNSTTYIHVYTTTL